MKRFLKYLFSILLIVCLFSLSSCDLEGLFTITVPNTFSRTTSDTVSINDSSSDDVSTSSSTKTTTKDTSSSSSISSSSTTTKNVIPYETTTTPESSSDSKYTGKDVTNIYFFSINDTHGQLYEDDPSSYQMSLAQVGGIINFLNENAEQDYIKICTGDLFQGSYVSNYTYGACMIDALNALDFDCMVLGNHEFDWGIEQIHTYWDGDLSNGEATYPLICCNVFDRSDNNKRPSWIEPYVIVDYYNIKVGIIGAIGGGLESTIAEASLGSFWFDDEEEHVKKYAKELRDLGCDVVVLADHDYTESTFETIANYTGSYAIDAFFAGHTHQNIEQTYRRGDGYTIPLIQSYTKNGNVGTIKLSLSNKKPNGYQIRHYDKKFFKNNNLSLDENVLQVLDDYQSIYDNGSRVIGTLTGQNIINSKETAADIMIKAMMWKYGGITGFLNTGGVRYTNPISGDVYYSDILELFPFDNKIVTFYMTGSQLITYYNRYNSSFYTDLAFDINDIDSTKTYEIVTIDYYYNKYLTSYRKNITGDIVMRDVLVEYIENGMNANSNPSKGLNLDMTLLNSHILDVFYIDIATFKLTNKIKF